MSLIPISRASASAAAAAALLLLAGCGREEAAGPGGDTGLDVVAGFYPLAEAAERVGGGRVSVQDLTPAGSEPHDLELTPDQVGDLEDADLVVVLGRGFQPAVEDVAARRDGSSLRVLDALAVPAGEIEDGHGDGHGAVDPHVWLDPTMMAVIVDEVADALVALDPGGADVFEANAAAYRQELEDLDARFATSLGRCERTTIVVAHDAFGWLAARYGLTQASIAGLSPEAEPNPARLSTLTDLVAAEGITTVFTETLVSPRVAETLAREAGVATAVLDPLEGLSEERLADGSSYTSVMEENLAALTDALGCA